ncbi:MAG: TRZ/ATZ family hydrolase [Gammaproteobacteria bacterium]
MTPTPCDLVVRARWLLPVAPANVVIDDGALAVHAGRIVAAGSADAVLAAWRPARLLHLGQHALLPGLVNAHGHAAMALMRGVAEDAPLEIWLRDHIWPLEGQLVDAEFVHDGTALAMAEMLRSGTTCFSDMYFFPERVAALATDVGMRCQIAFPVIDFPNAWSANADAGLHQGMALHDAYRRDPLVRIAFGPHAPYTVSRGTLERVLMFSEELDAHVQIHLHETAHEVAEARARTGSSWIDLLDDTGLLGPRLQAVHCTQLEPADIQRFAQHGVHVVHCPQSNLKLASGVCPTSALLAAGVNVALGSDGAASSNSLDLLESARLASLLAKLTSGDAATLPERQALELATLAGARALGLAHETGSLEPGKSADFVAIDLSAPRFLPVHDPISQLIHTGAGSAVTHVWVRGRALVTEGRLDTIDETALRARVDHWQQRIGRARP